MSEGKTLPTGTDINYVEHVDPVWIGSFNISSYSRSRQSKTALHLAVEVDDINAATFLLDHGADVHGKVSKFSPTYTGTPLHNVRSPEMAQLLLDRGAVLDQSYDLPNFALDTNSSVDKYTSALELALKLGRQEVAAFLLEINDTDGKNGIQHLSLEPELETPTLDLDSIDHGQGTPMVQPQKKRLDKPKAYRMPQRVKQSHRVFKAPMLTPPLKQLR